MRSPRKKRGMGYGGDSVARATAELLRYAPSGSPAAAEARCRARPARLEAIQWRCCARRTKGESLTTPTAGRAQAQTVPPRIESSLPQDATASCHKCWLQENLVTNFSHYSTRIPPTFLALRHRLRGGRRVRSRPGSVSRARHASARFGEISRRPLRFVWPYWQKERPDSATSNVVCFWLFSIQS